MNKNTEVIWICQKCGSEDILQRCWVNVNNNDSLEWIDTGGDEDFWCEQCQEHIRPIVKNEINKKEVEAYVSK